MFISKGCLMAVLENLTVLNKEVSDIKKAIRINEGSKAKCSKEKPPNGGLKGQA